MMGEINVPEVVINRVKIHPCPRCESEHVRVKEHKTSGHMAFGCRNDSGEFCGPETAYRYQCICSHCGYMTEEWFDFELAAVMHWNSLPKLSGVQRMSREYLEREYSKVIRELSESNLDLLSLPEELHGRFASGELRSQSKDIIEENRELKRQLKVMADFMAPLIGAEECPACENKNSDLCGECIRKAHLSNGMLRQRAVARDNFCPCEAVRLARAIKEGSI